MMYRWTFAFISFLFIASLFGCGSANPLLGTVGKEPITLQEFEEMYAKNNGGWEKAAQSTLEERERFLQLLVKYKLKLQEAQSKSLLKDSAVQNELASYRTSVTSSYMIEKELVEPNLKRMHERRKEMLRASHILARVPPNATPDDTLSAYNKVLRVMDRLSRTEFEMLARGFSEDPSATFNNGDLGWFTEGRMVREFEDACYGLKAGETTKAPVRSQFGYHLIKLTGRRPNRGSVQVSHILKRFSPSLHDTAAVRDSVYHLYNLLLRNEVDFSQAVQRYSDDPQSKPRDGDIGQYEPWGLPPELGKVFLTTPLDSIAVPYRASYGFHLFKITGIKEIPTYEEAERDLRQRYQQARYEEDYGEYVHALKKKFQLSFDVRLLYDLSHAFDSTKTASVHGWSDTVSTEWRPRILFTYSTNRFTVQNFLDYVQGSQEFQNYPLTSANVEKIVERVSELKMLEKQGHGIEERHPAFTRLMQEYQNGVLIYRLEQDEVWDKVMINDTLLQEYFRANQKMYRWLPRVNVAEIHVKTDSLAQALYKRLLTGEDFGALASEYTIRPGFKEKKGEWGLQQVGTNELINLVITAPVDTVFAPMRFETGWSILKILGHDQSRDKTFEEVLPELTSHYREYATKRREEQWIESLRQKYGVVLDSKRLAQTFKK